VERREREEPSLSVVKAERFQRGDAIIKRHVRRSRKCGSNGVPPRRDDPPRVAPAPALRYSANPAALLAASWLRE